MAKFIFLFLLFFSVSVTASGDKEVTFDLEDFTLTLKPSEWIFSDSHYKSRSIRPIRILRNIKGSEFRVSLSKFFLEREYQKTYSRGTCAILGTNWKVIKKDKTYCLFEEKKDGLLMRTYRLFSGPTARVIAHLHFTYTEKQRGYLKDVENLVSGIRWK